MLTSNVHLDISAICTNTVGGDATVYTAICRLYIPQLQHRALTNDIPRYK